MHNNFDELNWRKNVVPIIYAELIESLQSYGVR